MLQYLKGDDIVGLFRKLFKKEKTFHKVEEEIFELSNQNGRIQNPAKEDLKQYLNTLFDEYDQFITLTLPKAKNGIRYIQACFAGNDLIVQLGLEEGNKTYLVEKVCTHSQECIDIFYKFYESGVVDHVDDYKPVQF